MHAIEDWSEDEVVDVKDTRFEPDSHDDFIRVSLHAVEPQRMIRFRMRKNDALSLCLRLNSRRERVPGDN